MFQFLFAIQVIGIFILMAEIIYMIGKINSKSQVLMFMFTLEALLDSIGFLLEASSSAQETAFMGTRICYIGRAYLLLTVFLYIMQFCKIKIPKIISILLVIYHTFILSLVIFAEHTNLYYTKISYVNNGLYPHLEFEHGIMFFVFQATSVIYIIILMIALLSKLILTQSQSEKRKICILISAIIISIVGIYFYLTEYSQGYDTAGIGYCIAATIMLFGLFRCDVFASVEITKDHIIDTMEAGVIVLDDAENLLYSNTIASKLFPKLSTSEHKYELARLKECSEKNKKLFLEDNVYKVRKESIHTKENGHTYIIPDITDTFNYTTRLEQDVAEKTKELEAIILQAISAVANTIDAKDEYTKGHSVRVAWYSAQIARKLGKDENYINNLEYMAMLHDIGKIGVPDSVLNKVDPLTNTEFGLIKQHTIIGEEILKDITMVKDVVLGAKYHHERYDGTGYPQGLKGEEIPFEARIIGIADAYDAMTSNRVYRSKLPMDIVMSELIKGRGTQFDPNLTDILIELINADELDIKNNLSTIEQTLLSETKQLVEHIPIVERSEIQENDYDYLTGLYNKKALEREISKSMKNSSGVLMIIDIDFFKNINDSFGHLMGDYALKFTADVLRETIPENSVLGRRGADEFIVFLNNPENSDIIYTLTNSIFNHFSEKAADDKIVRNCSLSIGLSMICPMNTSYHKMFAQADKALYHVKQTGRNNVYMYSAKDQLAENATNTTRDIEQIIEIIHSNDNYIGALSLKMQEFRRVYEFTKNIAERYKYNQQMVLFTIENKNSHYETDELEFAMHSLQAAIQKSLRRVDISTRYGSSQIIVVLLDTDEQGVEITVNKIIQNFYKIQPNSQVNISYDYIDLN